jgi:CMP-N-acetylneuraminic acid synthetase
VDYSLRPDRDLTVLIPARAGSKRIPKKNTKLLGGKPLIQWTVEAATAANVKAILISTDDNAAKAIALNIWCSFVTRQPEHATDEAPDILWVLDCLQFVKTPYIAILRPTSPFRTASTIRRAYAALVGSGADSIRAVERVHHPHPCKMWTLSGKLMEPVLGGYLNGTPNHSCPTQSLPHVYVQNASLEMARTAVVRATQTISGYRIAPFLTDALEGFDINTPEDWVRAEELVTAFAGAS